MPGDRIVGEAAGRGDSSQEDWRCRNSGSTYIISSTPGKIMTVSRSISRLRRRPFLSVVFDTCIVVLCVVIIFFSIIYGIPYIVLCMCIHTGVPSTYI